MTEPLQLAMHGFGYIGRIHWTALQSASMVPALDPNVAWRLGIVRDVHNEAGQKAGQVFSHVTDDISSLLDHPVHALDVVSPNDAHLAVVQAATRRNIPVYCEKPLADTLSATREMTTVVCKTGIVNQVALNYRFLPAVEQAYEVLKSGILGRVLTFRATLLHGGYLDPNRGMAWRLQKSKSGAGALMDLGVHVIDLVHMLLGHTGEVRATLRTFVPERRDAMGTVHAVDVDDWANLEIALQSGAAGTIEVSRVHFGQEASELSVVCEGGTLKIDLHHPEHADVHRLNGAAPGPWKGVLRPFRIPVKYTAGSFIDSHAASLLTFLHRVRGKRLDYPVPVFEDALRAEEVVEAALRSNQLGTWVTVNR